MEVKTNGIIPFERRRSRSLNISFIKEKDDKIKTSNNKMIQSMERRSKLMKTNELNLPSNIQVHVRVRPLINSEILKSSKKCLSISSSKKIFCGEDREFNYDMLYSENDSHKDLFENSIKSNLERSFEGYNFSTFAYGQTAAGKTYTMGTMLTNKKTSENDKGVIQLSVDYIFLRLKEISSANNCEFIVKASFIEIYNEEIRDLLNLKTPSKNIILRDNNTNNSVNILGITEMPVLDAEDVISLVSSGSLNRKTGSTYTNDTSSRSHAIFTLNFEKVSSVSTINFKINFIDLAGSERIKKSGATGERLKESVSINSGLLSLSKVIMALAEESKRNSSKGVGSIHIPYRESKLTRILKDSLGGNSLTLMIACVSPSSLNQEETINTLNYASFARSIKIQPMIYSQLINNPNEVVIENLRKENEELKRKIEMLKENITQNNIDIDINERITAENYKLKNILKIIKQKLISKDEDELIGIENLFLEINMSDDNNLENLQLEELKKNYAYNDCKVIPIGLEYAEKISENIRLKEKNEIFNNELELLREKGDEYIYKLGQATDLTPNAENITNSKYILNEYFNSNNNDQVIIKPVGRYSHHKCIRSNKIRVNRSSDINNNEGSFIEVSNLESTYNPFSPDKLNQKKSSQTTPKKKRTSNSMSSLDPHKPDSQIGMIFDKIKKLKEFQNSLKTKILENDFVKNKLVRNKNEEITYVKRDMMDKTKKMKNLVKINERNNELIEHSENTINILKEELRNKSIELKKIKIIPLSGVKMNSNNINNLIPQSSKQSQDVKSSNMHHKKSYSVLPNDACSYNYLNQNSSLVTDQNKFKNSLIICGNNSVSTLISNLEEPTEFYMNMKVLMRNIEDLIIQKHKFEKKAKYLQKEKTEFLNILKINEERLNNKIKSLNKLKISLENIIRALDENNKERVSYTFKYQNTMNKINSLSIRLERMSILQENTLREISTNEDLIKTQMDNIENNINEIKNRISCGKINEGNSNLANIIFPNEQKVKNNITELKNIVKEKDEKIMFIELDNKYKENKILEMEKSQKETILNYEDKLFRLQFEIENSINENYKDNEDLNFNKNKKIEVNTINKQDYDTLVKSGRKSITKPNSANSINNNKKTIFNLPPTSINGNIKKKEDKIKIQSTINELTSTPRKNDLRVPESAKILTKTRGFVHSDK